MSTQITIKQSPIKNLYTSFLAIDPRWVIFTLLASYLILGFTILGFNRTPQQALVTTLSTGLFEVVLARIFKKRWIFPLSALITSCSLSILLNYSHNYWVLMVPVFFAISSKYVFTVNDRHFFNPAQIAVTMSLIFAGDLISAAPAYQWNGIEMMAAFVAVLGIFLLLPKINRHYLVIAFLVTFTLQTLMRALIMQHHLPFETLFLGTLSSPAFMLFTFFMITDPATSPANRKTQIWVGISIATIDLLLHLKQSYYTFFFAGAIVQSSRALWAHLQNMRTEGSLISYFHHRFIVSGHYQKVLTIFLIGLIGNLTYAYWIKPQTYIENLSLSFQKIAPSQSNIQPKMGNTLERVDPRVQHLAKWLMSVGDSVAAADVNNDGLVDLFFTFPLKDDQDRNSLYLNRGNFEFDRIELPIIKESKEIEKYGISSNAIFVDYDNDGDQDIFLVYAFGSPFMLENQLTQTGRLEFLDVTYKLGLQHYTNSITANFFDFNNDGLLDLYIGNVWPIHLPDYPADSPQKLNLFNLPKAEYAGDDRMFNFMHASWHMANNGGLNELWIQQQNLTYTQLDSQKLKMPETRWTLAIGTADFNQDGWTDLYIANDFGADDLYYNQNGKTFQNIKGKMFGDIGRDTYKGMNATVADFDNNGTSDVYISNVHHAYQAEGSLLWMWHKNQQGHLNPMEQATFMGALNEKRFGWGAAAGDLDHNGWIDIVQANGMVDDTIDKKWDECPDFWYVNEKIALSPPHIHRYVNRWGDIRGMCIYGKEQNRVYLNTKEGKANTFVDVAGQVGLTEKTNSRGVALVDLDNDGKLDIVITHMFQGPSLYKNTMSTDTSWLGVELESLDTRCNREAIGSVVKMTYHENGKQISQMREKVMVNGFNAQSEKRLLFGLNNYQGPVHLQIKWCGQIEKNYTIEDINRYHQLVLQ